MAALAALTMPPRPRGAQHEHHQTLPPRPPAQTPETGERAGPRAEKTPEDHSGHRHAGWRGWTFENGPHPSTAGTRCTRLRPISDDREASGTRGSRIRRPHEGLHRTAGDVVVMTQRVRDGDYSDQEGAARG